MALFAGQKQPRKVNLAIRRIPKPHVAIKYLNRDFAELFVHGLAGLGPQGFDDGGLRGRELLRNTATGKLALAAGLRLQEFTYLLVYEIPPLPPVPMQLPIPFPVASALTKGGKFRTTLISYDALAAVHRYIALDRAINAVASRWLPSARLGPPIYLSDVDSRGGWGNGQRVRWDAMAPRDRVRLVAPDGGSALLSVPLAGRDLLAELR